MAHYDGDVTVAEARSRYFAANGFGDGGYDQRWVKLQAGPVPIFLPNSAQRVRSVRLHDLHHVATEYDTTWTGEAEIGAWEIASSCANHWAAWVLNLWAMAIGLVIAPSAVFRAFVRGRHCTNLYRGEFDDVLLRPPVRELRARLGLDRPPPPATRGDRLAFVGWSVAGAVALLASAVPTVLLVVLLTRLVFG